MHVMNKHRTKLTRTDIRIYNRLRVDARLTEIDEPWEVELEPGELRRRLCRWWIAVTCFRLPALPMSQRWSSISRRRCNHQWREEGEGRSREGWDAKGQVRRESGNAEIYGALCHMRRRIATLLFSTSVPSRTVESTVPLGPIFYLL
jgi:hypothetical protein